MKLTKTNPNTVKLIESLTKQSSAENAPIWKAVANDLKRANRKNKEVNVYHIDKYTKDDDTILVPGKVLGEGNITRKVTVAAFKFSKEAEAKITAAGGKCLKIEELMAENPKGSNVTIIK
ncbi:MAG: 50S ribosomal protein L18e [Methanosphaera sp.]|nr:50S ribosomal protein L18e [Methanosphaera sp.]